jgi:hypothetical protein
MKVIKIECKIKLMIRRKFNFLSNQKRSFFMAKFFSLFLLLSGGGGIRCGSLA